MLRFEETLSGWTEKRLTQEEAARSLGVCARTFRRYLDRREEAGLDGLADTRASGHPGRSRAPIRRIPDARSLRSVPSRRTGCPNRF